jgi:hypothetical protein
LDEQKRVRHARYSARIPTVETYRIRNGIVEHAIHICDRAGVPLGQISRGKVVAVGLEVSGAIWSTWSKDKCVGARHYE